jgi:DNA polymerase
MAYESPTLDALNRELRACSRCALHLTRENVLCGEGDPAARIMLIAQAPGEREDREGRMFIGPSGKVLDELLDESRISRTRIYMTNLVKCRLPKNRRPKQEEIRSCSPFLEREIALVDPEVLVPLGYYATRYLLESNDIPIPTTRAEFAALYGELFLAGERKIYPLPHPASLLYDTSFRPATAEKYKKLKILSQDCNWFPFCPMKRFHDEGYLDRVWIERYCKGDWERCIRYRLEQRGRYHPDWMLPDGTLDERLKR